MIPQAIPVPGNALLRCLVITTLTANAGNVVIRLVP